MIDEKELKILAEKEADIKCQQQVFPEDNWADGYIDGYRACEQSDEYKKLVKNAEAWELLIDRINDQCEKTEDGPTKEMVYELWNAINNGEIVKFEEL